MESYLVILGLMGIVVFIGSFVGFLSLFSKKPDDGQRLKALEDELWALKQRLEQLERTAPRNTNESAAVIPPPVLEVVAPSLTPTVADPPENGWRTDPANKPEDQWIDPYATGYDPLFAQGFAAAKNWLFGGNTLVRSGVVILFIGISFLLKYAAEHTYVPIELRLTAIALAGCALLFLGWRLRTARQEYAWALQGGGIGILYLTIFAAFKLYQLMPAGLTFTLLASVAFLSALVAILQSAMPLAILGFTGGFLAPIFTATGQGSHVGLFSYYLVLNLAIAFIAYYRSWRPLNVIGFAFTFIIGALWGANNYQPAYFTSTEPFLVIHFLLFTMIAIFYAYRQAPKATDYVDATLVLAPRW